MSPTQFLSGILSVFFIQQVFSQPPYEIIKSCVNSKPANPSITITLLDGGGFSEHAEKNCDEPYVIRFENKKISYVSCDDKDYLEISGKKLFLSESVNMSVNPEVKPEVLYPQLSSWMKLDSNSQSYVCISGPLSQSGAGANTPQYLIIENAFNSNVAPIAYYYFFNKDIIPITSRNF
ncbi:Uncharacterised protein (plasmid) [Legionella adelaidensis]|uniref:Uncharacterized protein n=1 Tax=Legionella adelaidensis TaxID=45056 RepID=A0A0W0R3X9_9GAMM|nr:hypothetical protein [Legionella adelaidensis]KTC65753.1 hypothetical protein Lade_0411 [Legionella adelaidensis]VEH85081.1 Uncharacterised protein [Legionella adelaidensis]